MTKQTVGPAEPTGERFIPEAMGGQLIDAEHQARYRFALPHVAGKRVLDAGCGVGWGSDLIHQAGAAEVVGLDLSAEAIDASRHRVANAAFVVGDLQAMPFEDGRFDVVVCFEALEHTTDTSRTLDELVRVLAPGGVLFVSSPNPAVYPPGNPFHIEELPPDELRAAIGKRLPHVAMFRQHSHLSSMIYPDAAQTPTAAPFTAQVHPVTPIAPGHDPYSVVVASAAALPDLDIVEALAPSTQLDQLGALAAALAEERTALHAEIARVNAEWSAAVGELRDSRGELRQAESAVRRVMSERDEAQSSVGDLRSTAEALNQQLARQRLVATNAARERDELGMRLIETQQSLALVIVPRSAEVAALQARVDELSALIDAREAELTAIRATVSWRMTRPLRTVRSAIGRARGA